MQKKRTGSDTGNDRHRKISETGTRERQGQPECKKWRRRRYLLDQDAILAVDTNTQFAYREVPIIRNIHLFAFLSSSPGNRNNHFGPGYVEYSPARLMQQY